MHYILTPAEMRKADETAIKEFHIPSQILMENAARSSAEIITEILHDNNYSEPNLCILCGSGNNGGDGFGLARHLDDIYDITVIWIGSEDKMSPETHTNFKSIQKSGLNIKNISDINDILTLDMDFDVFIDSLIGVGGSENLHGLVLEILKKIDRTEALKIAIDVPTGLNSETGFANQFSFKADYTITMYAPKTGLYLNEGINYSGKIITAYLGAPESIVESISNIFMLDEFDIGNILPERQTRSSKFDYGRVLVIAGSSLYPGAAALCSNAAITSGAGLVQLCTTTIHPAVLPEVITHTLASTFEGTIADSAYDYIIKASDKANSIIIGPGLGDVDETINLVRKLIKNISNDKTLIIDADGLKAIDMSSSLRKNIILTPHTGEFARILNIDRIDVEKDTFNKAKYLASKLNCNVLLKDVPSIISDGNKSFFNVNGNPGMATGGSGDVLSGIIGGFVALGIEPLMAAAYGAFIHAEAGDMYAIENSELTLTASDLIVCFKKLMKKFYNGDLN
ncbi:MAG: NAD(P)H-hydrate dehydratase [Ignavibacteriae bacterium]|nr:NAD(P)H-hydrate dehydratase [Ignavibacteriota bacterium]